MSFLSSFVVAHSKIRSNASPLVEYFPDYTGPPGDLEAAKQYMKHKFISLSRQKDRGLYVHLTCVRLPVLPSFDRLRLCILGVHVQLMSLRCAATHRLRTRTRLASSSVP